MRWLGRLLMLLVAVGLLLIVTRSWYGEQWRQERAAQQAFGHLAQAKALTVYELSTEQWTRFSLVASDPNLRVISNAELSSGQYSSDERWHYALDYRLVSPSGKVLRQGTYHHRTQLTQFINEEDGTTYTNAMHFPKKLQPADGRVMQINFTEAVEADYLELRVNNLQAPLQRIVARIYQKKNFSEREASFQWQRMSQRRRNQVGDISVYPVELLNEQEKINILKRRWIRLAPIGTQDKDYFIDKLYVLEEHEGLPLEAPVYKAGLRMGAGLKAMIPLPAPAGHLRLEISPLLENSLPAEGQLKWYGRPATLQKQWQLSAADGSLTWRGQVDQGLLELDWSAPAFVRVWQQHADGETEITPSQSYLRAYLLDAQQPVSFTISHVAQQATPLRIDLRTDTATAVPVRYAMRSAEGKVLDTGSLVIQPQASEFDRAHGDPEQPVSDPVRRFFSLPATVASFQLSSDAPIYVSAYSRPAGLVRTIEVPPLPESEVTLPAWFPIRPTDYENLRMQGRSAIITTQRRPPQVDPLILAGQYRWEQFRPQGKWQARYLLTRLQASNNKRDQLLASGFRPLKPIDNVFFPSPYGRQTIDARLLYQRNQSGPMTIRLHLNDKMFIEKKVFARSGELRLPPLPAGEQQLKVSGDALFYISATNSPEWLKRKVLRLDNRAHEFVFNKATENEELLSLRFYGDNREQHIDRWIEVQLKNLPERANGPMQSWTFSSYRYLVHPNKTASSMLIGAVDADNIDAGQSLFIAFGDDMPAGDYRVAVRLVSGSPGYVSFSKTTPGDYSRLELFDAP